MLYRQNLLYFIFLIFRMWWTPYRFLHFYIYIKGKGAEQSKQLSTAFFNISTEFSTFSTLHVKKRALFPQKNPFFLSLCVFPQSFPENGNQSSQSADYEFSCFRFLRKKHNSLCTSRSPVYTKPFCPGAKYSQRISFWFSVFAGWNEAVFLSLLFATCLFSV